MFASSWFITNFASELPIDVVIRIYDIILSESTSILFNFALALLKRNQSEILRLPFEETVELLMHGLYGKKFNNAGNFIYLLYLKEKIK